MMMLRTATTAHPLRSPVGLATHEHHRGLWPADLAGALQHGLRLLEAVAAGDVERGQQALPAPGEAVRDGPEPLLPRCVPDLWQGQQKPAGTTSKTRTARIGQACGVARTCSRILMPAIS